MCETAARLMIARRSTKSSQALSSGIFDGRRAFINQGLWIYFQNTMASARMPHYTSRSIREAM
jgi:hypothetical protein